MCGILLLVRIKGLWNASEFKLLKTYFGNFDWLENSSVFDEYRILLIEGLMMGVPIHVSMDGWMVH